MDTEIDSLKAAVEGMHHCHANYVQSVPVSECFGHKIVWVGTVHIFDVAGNPASNRAFAWSSPIEGSDKRRFFAVLCMGKIDSPTAAVRAAIVAEQRSRK